jgi:hypothetical protein
LTLEAHAGFGEGQSLSECGTMPVVMVKRVKLSRLGMTASTSESWTATPQVFSSFQVSSLMAYFSVKAVFP